MDQRLNLSSSPTALKLTWSAPFVAILVGHWLVDTYSNMIPSSLGIIRISWDLSDRQAAWLLGAGSLTSGLAQPFFAWISDRADNRIFGAIGLFLAATMISSLGMAHSQVALFAFYLIGMMGVGMFHPIGASTIGQLNPLFRARAVSFFFVAGMGGGITGAFVAPRLLTLPNGFQIMCLLMLPGILVALYMYSKLANLQQLSISTRQLAVSTAGPHSAWGAMALLYVSSALRFSVNMALVYLYVRWTEHLVGIAEPALSAELLAERAAPYAGNLNAAMISGMAVGGLSAGLLIPTGREKLPLVILPAVFAPFVALFPWASLSSGCVLSFFAGIGFASLVPVSLALAQRLIPHRSNLASGIMLGGAWAVAMTGPALAEYCVESYGLRPAFLGTAVVLALSGLFTIPVATATIRESAASAV